MRDDPYRKLTNGKKCLPWSTCADHEGHPRSIIFADASAPFSQSMTQIFTESLKFNEREVMGSIPWSDRPTSLKLIVLAFRLGAQGYSTTTGLPVSG